MNVILSIKPKFANAIFAGEKKVEFRKSLFKKKVDRVLVYSSAPVKRIIGSFTISEIIKNTPEKLWQQFGDVGGIEEKEFFNYFGNRNDGYSIHIADYDKFDSPIEPRDLIENFTPPQSFRYYDGSIQPLLEI